MWKGWSERLEAENWTLNCWKVLFKMEEESHKPKKKKKTLQALLGKRTTHQHLQWKEGLSLNELRSRPVSRIFKKETQFC